MAKNNILMIILSLAIVKNIIHRFITIYYLSILIYHGG